MEPAVRRLDFRSAARLTFEGFRLAAARPGHFALWSLIVCAGIFGGVLLGRVFPIEFLIWLRDTLVLNGPSVMGLIRSPPSLFAGGLVTALVLVSRRGPEGRRTGGVGRVLRLALVVMVIGICTLAVRVLIPWGGPWDSLALGVLVAAATPLTLVGPAYLEGQPMRPAVGLARASWGPLMLMNLLTFAAYELIHVADHWAFLAILGAADLQDMGQKVVSGDPEVAWRLPVGGLVEIVASTFAIVVVAAPWAAAWRALTPNPATEVFD